MSDLDAPAVDPASLAHAMHKTGDLVRTVNKSCRFEGRPVEIVHLAHNAGGCGPAPFPRCWW
jgi:hypothetical protein